MTLKVKPSNLLILILPKKLNMNIRNSTCGQILEPFTTKHLRCWEANITKKLTYGL